MTTTPAATGGYTPIETEYNGYKFRSRLEARWAYYFDLCKIRWAYEQEGYTLSDGQRYLPDFWLPDCNQFVEVKPACDAIALTPPDLSYRFVDIDEPGNHDVRRSPILFVEIDDKWTPPCQRTTDAIVLLQTNTLCTVIFTDKDEGDIPEPPDGWRNPTLLVDPTDFWCNTIIDRFWVSVQARSCGTKHMVALADAQDVATGFRVVFGDPREMTHIANLTTRELPFNLEAATAARRHRFDGRTA
jgi:hypothetical protein